MILHASLTGRKLRVGTRGSALALAQTLSIRDWLIGSHPGLDVEIMRIRTTGDIRSQEPISAMAGRGVFVDAIEQSVLMGESDFAVHSAKDLPARDADGLRIAAYPAREDARDVLISRDGSDLRSLPHAARIGTSSQRRAAQIVAIRPDVRIVELRGNVDTRIRKVDEGEYDAIVLAAAGLIRLSLSHRISEWLPFETFLPAPAQGALAIQVREDDLDLASAFSSLNDLPTAQAVTAERSFLARLGTGCASPVAAHGIVSNSELGLTGFLHSRGGEALRYSLSGSAARATAIGEQLADHLTSLDAA